MKFDRLIFAVAFLAGFTLMSLEMVGSRLLAPFFGYSVYVWGSLIGIFLFSLSLGYLLGGRIADRYDPRRSLGWLFLLAGTWIFLLPYAATWIATAIVIVIGEDRSGTIMAATAMFLFPCLMLGSTSPLLLKVAVHDLSRIGRLSGRINAVSTVGNILGTVLTAFILLNHLSVATIFKLLGLIAMLLGIAHFAVGRKPAALLALLPLFLFLKLPDHHFVNLQGLEGEDRLKVVAVEDSVYHQIVVLASEKRRVLQFTYDVEGGVSLPDERRSLYRYTDFLHVPFFYRPGIGKILIVGHGCGIGVIEIADHHERVDITVVDVDRKVFEMARSYFPETRTVPFEEVVADARRYLQTTSERFDFIYLDAYSDAHAVPFHLVTREFFELLRDRLTPGGIVGMNLYGTFAGRGAPFLWSVVKTVRAAFPHLRFLPVLQKKYDPRRPSHHFFLASFEPLDDTAALERFARFPYEARQTLRRSLAEGLPCQAAYLERLDRPGIIVMTDDFVPVDRLLFGMLRNGEARLPLGGCAPSIESL